MDENQEENGVYRFASWGARGKIELKADCIHSRTRTHLGWWEQTIPLQDLSPNYSTLVTAPQTHCFAWPIAIMFAALGSYQIYWGLSLFPHKLIAGFLLGLGLWLMWHLYRTRKVNWIMFPAARGIYGVNYTRQGPDQSDVDDFTSRVGKAINLARDKGDEQQ